MSKKKPSEKDFSDFIQQVQLVGCSRGLVKKLSGFKKNFHAVPDAATPAATAFLGKLCTAELGDEAEVFFQRARSLLHYKRKEISLSVAGTGAVIIARDFTLEWAYALDPGAPENFIASRTLHNVSDGTMACTEEFDTLFAGMFEDIEFTLTKPVQVEAVIDAIESLDNSTSIAVDYPSDCKSCTLHVNGVPAEAIFTGAVITMRFARPGSPRELLEAYATVRSAFSLTKSSALAALL